MTYTLRCKKNMSSPLSTLGPVKYDRRLCTTEEQEALGLCFGLTGPSITGSNTPPPHNFESVIVNVDNDKVEQVMLLWTSLTNSNVLHNYVQKHTTYSSELGDIILEKGTEPKYSHRIVKKDGYNLIEEAYMRTFNMTKEEFHDMHMNMLANDDSWSLLECKRFVVDEGKDPVLDPTGKRIELTLFMEDIKHFGLIKLREVVEQIKDLIRSN